MSNPIGFVERITAIGGAAIFALVIFGVASLLHRAISNNDDRKRIQGRPVRWWVTGLYFIGAVVGAILADNQRYYLHEVVGGTGGFGILAGLVIGNFHGWINLLRSPDIRGPSDLDDAEPLEESSCLPQRKDENPYLMPNER